MSRTSLFLLAAAALLAAACAHRFPESLELQPKENRGVVFGRLAPLANAKQGVVEFRRADESVLKVGLDPDGYFVAKAAPGPLRLAAFNYRQGDKLHEVTLGSPPTFEVKAGVVGYVGLLIISPLSQDVFLTDDFVRDGRWFASVFGDRLTPTSTFANRYFYELMRRYGEAPAPEAHLENGRAAIPGGKFLMGDVWPGGGVAGPGGVDRTQIPPREVALSPFKIEAWPVSAADEAAAPGAAVVANVSWRDADRICRDRGGRLPTEAEWELAARGPRWGARYYGGAPHVGAGAAIGDAARPPVGDLEQWARSPYGVFHHGASLAEWTNDWTGPAETRDAGATDPQGAASGNEKVVRAGPYRFALAPDAKTPAVGFRCVFGGAALRPAPPPPAAQPKPIEPRAAADGPSKRALTAVKADASLYAAPSLQSAVVGHVLGGQLVTRVAESGEFVLVQLDNGDEGFVRRSDLAEDGGEQR